MLKQMGSHETDTELIQKNTNINDKLIGKEYLCYANYYTLGAYSEITSSIKWILKGAKSVSKSFCTNFLKDDECENDHKPIWQ